MRNRNIVSKRLRLTSLTLFAVFLLSACQQTTVESPLGIPHQVQSQLEEQGVGWLPTPLSITDSDFITDQNKPFNLSELKGRWTLLFFGYTFCPDVCPMTLSLLSNSIKNITTITQREGNNDDITVNVVLVSVDPDRDKPSALGPYMEYFNPDFIGLTGNPTSLQRLTTELHAFYSKTERKEEDQDLGYIMDHSANIVILSPELQYLGYITPPHQIQQLTEIIATLSQLKPAS